MKTKQVWRTDAAPGVAVSTVLIHDGGARFYETALILGGTTTDGRRTTKKFDAGIEHDAAVAFARGYKDPTSTRNAFWAAQVDQSARG